MRKTLCSLLLALSSTLIFAANSPYNILPLPENIRQDQGTLAFSSCRIQANGVPVQVREMAKEFSTLLSNISTAKAGGKSPVVTLRVNNDIPAEGYILEITAKGVEISAKDYNGFLYGFQSLKQLLPEEMYGDQTAPGADWTLPCCRIEDKPHFSYRGSLLDICRHLYSVEEVCKYLDAMAMCKMNRFHWHLTEDQGWRIQIDSYPLLTKVGAWRKGTQIGFDRKSCDGVKYGGFYTKDQIRKVVAYAAKLGIEVIPEIDLPGHMVAALASYPELGCTGGPYEVRTSWGVAKEVLCPGKEETFKFLEAVLGEVVELFPCKMIHIGGDECPRDAWKACPDCQALIAKLGLKDDDKYTKEDYLQTYVMNRIQEFLATKGKTVIGWDEILRGNPSKETTIMFWKGSKDCTEAAKRGYNTILVPNTYLYFDFCQMMDYSACPPSIARDRKHRIIPFTKAYSYDPYAGLNEEQQKRIIGVQCNLWTEYIATPEHLEYMTMPRMFAASELQWQDPKEPKDLERVIRAIREHGYKMLDARGFVYCTTIE